MPRKRKPKQHAGAEDQPNVSIDANALFRSAAYRRLPLDVRTEVDSAIICRPPGQSSIKAIFKHFRLEERYNLAYSTFWSYAKRLEKAARPIITGHFLASTLGCLPKRYRDQVLTGGEVILVSRVLAVLTAATEAKAESKDQPPPPTLSIADLAKLAGIFTSLGRSTKSKSKEEAAPQVFDPENVLQAVQELYGCSSAREDAEQPVKTAETDELVQNATLDKEAT